MDNSVINQICSEFVELYRKELTDAGNLATRNLYNNITYKFSYDGKYFELYLILEDYWKYVENGRKAGKFPPLSNIEEWIKVKNIIPYTNDGKIPSTKQLAYVIGRSIAEHGTKAYKPLQKAIDKSDDLTNRIIDELFNEITQELEKEETL